MAVLSNPVIWVDSPMSAKESKIRVFLFQVSAAFRVQRLNSRIRSVRCNRQIIEIKLIYFISFDGLDSPLYLDGTQGNHSDVTRAYGFFEM